MYKNSKKAGGSNSKYRKILFLCIFLAVFIVIGYFAYNRFYSQTIQEKIENSIVFDETFTEKEKQKISDEIIAQNIEIKGNVNATVNTVTEAMSSNLTIEAFIPVTAFDSGKQAITSDELAESKYHLLSNTDSIISSSIAEILGSTVQNETSIDSTEELSTNEIAIIPVSDLSYYIKLLSLNDSYYLDTFNSGAIYRVVSFTGEGAADLNALNINNYSDKESTLKINQTGVTALTRVMQTKLNQVKDPLYFSEYIGPFLADADLTHVSNEVSFKEGCDVSYTSFCSDPVFIETLKDSGVDIVEITGNHNNDRGSVYNTETINLYKSLGWGVFGGGLNAIDGRNAYNISSKNNDIAMLGYNYPDSPNGVAIAGTATAGANSFDFEKIKEDIDKEKAESKYVIVDVQYWECYSYPDGYVEYPICDAPIGEQEEVFKKLIDLGADMVVGTQAHQPQTYELYNGKPIYYGLGNLYFDQTQWPGTERGVILTHYFVDGELVQTKLSPTRFDASLQTKLSSQAESEELLTRLLQAN